MLLAATVLALATRFDEPTILSVPMAQAETPAQRDARMQWWRDARFGMFIHFGLYSTPAGVWKGEDRGGAGEWLQFNAKIPAAEYEPLLPQFNPVKFDAKEWVRIAKDAGMKYITITTKHHEGFALFDSKLTEWDVMATPFQRDIMKELAAECTKQGIVICWYHSILDWHHPDYLPRGPGSERPWDTRPTAGASYDRYIEFMKGQLTELLTNYGKIGTIWFDGGWEHTAEVHHADEVIALIRKLQPRIIINDRIQVPQDYSTPEQFIPATGIPGRDWETCMTMNGTWGYRAGDQDWKPAQVLVRNLVDIASKGGNFLLNVGPTGEGLIPGPSVERLAAMGRWMKVNGESIYGTTASPFKRLAFGRCTTKTSSDPAVGGTRLTLYLHVFDWPADGRLRLPGLRNSPGRASLLADPARAGVSASRDGDDMVITLPGAAPDPVASVVALDIVGVPEVVNPTTRPDAEGIVRLDAIDAEIHGTGARYEGEPDKQCVGFWLDPKDFVSFDFQLPHTAAFTVEIEYACDPAAAGSEVQVAIARPEQPGPEFKLTVGDTGGWTKFVTAKLGTAPQLAAGRWTLTVKPLQKKGNSGVMNLRRVTLQPQR